MVGLGRIARSRTNPAIGFVQQVRRSVIFLRRIGPKFTPYPFMHPLGKRFGKPVSQCFDHDRAVIIIGAGKALGNLVFRLAHRHHKSADIIRRA